MTYREFKEEWEDSNDYIVCHTSGSTGVPSKIELPKEQMKRSAERTCNFFGIDSSSHLHSCISPDFIGGKMMWVRSAVKGCLFSWETPSNKIFQNYSRSSFDLVSVVPSQMVWLLNNVSTLPTVRNYLIGGAPIPHSLRQLIVERNISAWESYGMTETSSHIALRKVTLDDIPFSTLEGITVHDNDSGTLTITIDGWMTLSTNDIATVFSPDSFIITGRADNVINSGGKKIQPEIIEKKLSSEFKFDFAISSLPDALWGERVVIVVEGLKINDERLSETFNRLLERYEIPKEIIRIDKLPRTKNGKIDRVILKKSI